MSKQTICITGASSGIGAALALGYAKPNTVLLLIARNKDRLNAVAAECEHNGATVIQGLIDVCDKDNLSAWLIDKDEQFPIDLLIVNAGLSTTQASKVSEGEFAAESMLVDVHLQGMLNTIFPLISRMQQRQSGQIALMSSMNAFIPIPRSCIYGAVKCAILHYGLALRTKLAENNIKVSVMCPGWVKTALTDANTYDMPFMMNADAAANILMDNIAKNKAIIAFPWQLKIALKILNWLPLFVREKISLKLK